MMKDTALVNVRELLAKIVPHVSGCNDAMAELMLIEAARTFARESDIVIESQTFPKNEAPAEYSLPENSSLPEKFLPLHFISKTYSDNGNTVTVTYSLLPIDEYMPDNIVKRHYEAITAQALFQLFNTPGKPWTNPDLGNFYLQKYRIALGDAMRDNNTNGAVFHQQALISEDSEIFLG